MTWTLYKYLAKDLTKTALLASTALTLLLTVIGIIEPLQKQGLAPSQVLKLFWYLVPVMLSLTLPVAALFSATFVCGRFSMDNELTAAKSGGVSVYALLKPALVMGILVSVATLALSNWVAPELARRGEETARADLHRMVFRSLKSKRHLRIGKVIVRADESFPEEDRLRGVVAINLEDPADAEYAVASLAYVKFSQSDGTTEVTCNLVNPSLGRQRSFDSYQASSVPFAPPALDSLVKEDPTFHDWQELASILQDPCRSDQVRQRLERIYRQLHAIEFYEEMAEAICAGRTYSLYDTDGRRYAFRATAAVVHQGKPSRPGRNDGGASRLRLTGTNASPEPRQVYVTRYDADGKVLRIFQSHEVTVRAQYIPSLAEFSIRADFHDVLTRGAADTVIRRGEWIVTDLKMPAGLRTARKVSRENLEELYRHPQRFPSVAGSLKGLDRFIQKLTLKIIAEMHGRIAYGAGCFLLVAAGAALGLVFRGGHILSAFALSCLPALVLLVLLIMGKQMVANPDASRTLGLASIWGGVGLVGSMTAYLYGVVLRR